MNRETTSTNVYDTWIDNALSLFMCALWSQACNCLLFHIGYACGKIGPAFSKTYLFHAKCTMQLSIQLFQCCTIIEFIKRCVNSREAFTMSGGKMVRRDIEKQSR